MPSDANQMMILGPSLGKVLLARRVRSADEPEHDLNTVCDRRVQRVEVAIIIVNEHPLTHNAPPLLCDLAVEVQQMIIPWKTARPVVIVPGANALVSWKMLAVKVAIRTDPDRVARVPRADHTHPSVEELEISAPVKPLVPEVVSPDSV